MKFKWRLMVNYTWRNFQYCEIFFFWEHFGNSYKADRETDLSASQMVTMLSGKAGSDSDWKLSIWGSAARSTLTLSPWGLGTDGQRTAVKMYDSHSFTMTTNITSVMMIHFFVILWNYQNGLYCTNNCTLKWTYYLYSGKIDFHTNIFSYPNMPE